MQNSAAGEALSCCAETQKLIAEIDGTLALVIQAPTELDVQYGM
jgi:hypothetical protein